MQISSHQLLDQLIRQNEAATLAAQKLKQELNEVQLNSKPTPQTWSILECIEHLNLYGDYYLPEIEKRLISSQKADQSNRIFKSGIIGNYFANSMLVNEGKIQKMKTPKDKNPAFVSSQVSSLAIERFLKQQEKLRTLLIDAKNIDLNKVKTSIALTSLIKLKLGDTLRFVVYHIDRHLWQANNVRKSLKH